jgi:hypothetical protein
MSSDRNTASDGTPRDPRHDTLYAEWLTRERSREQREAEHHEALNRQRESYDSMVKRQHRQADLIENIELDRLQFLRSLRYQLDQDKVAGEDLAGKAFACLGLEYLPGKSKVEDLYAVEPLAHSVAAARAGVPSASTVSDGFLKVLKYAGMVGCLLLSTLGMGALLLHIAPRALVRSPLLIVALGLGSMLVGGAYLAVVPGSRRFGSLLACRPNDPVTKRSRVTLPALVAGLVILVALVDAKALMAINSARAMINPESGTSFAVTFLVAAALSATYILGTAILACSEGFAIEAAKRIEAEQAKHQEAFRKGRKELLEVTQACEALNAVDGIETRRKGLNEEISAAEAGLRESLRQAYTGVGAPPELSDAQRKLLRFHEQEARFAGQKLNAYEAVRQKPHHADQQSPGSDA